MKKFLFLVVAIIALLFETSSQSTNAFAVQVKIDNGIIEGNYNTHSGIQTYFGVPFAKPPVGNLRWKAPQPLDKWNGVKQTKNFGPRPMQTIVFGDMNDPKSEVSKLIKSGRRYNLLEDLYTKPSVNYLTKIRNKIS